MAEGARLESVYRLIPYRGFESPSLRHFTPIEITKRGLKPTRSPHSRLSWFITLAFALLSITTFYSTSFAAIPDSAQPTRIIKVIDGDTVIVELNKRREHVRLIGIDTPETRPNRRAEIQAQNGHLDQKTILQLGHRASTYTRELLPKNSTVFLEFDTSKRDKYRRLLAYIWIQRSPSTQAQLVNEEILKAGYAYVLTIPPNVKYRQRFAKAFSEARQAKRGLWSK